METASLIVQAILDVLTAATLGAVIFYTWKTSQLTAATRDMAKAAHLQRADQYRPLLVPSGTPVFQSDHPNWLDWSEAAQQFTIGNIGPGAALNIAAVLYGCESYVIGELGQQQRMHDTKDNHWTAWLGEPIAPNGSTSVTCKYGTGVFLEHNKHIGQHQFNAPPEPFAGEAMSGHTPFKLARITVTATDALGHKHANIFDYEQHTKGWRLVEFTPGIERDLQDLEG